MDPNIVTLENGDQYRIEGFGDLSEDQRTQRLAQLETAVRSQKIDERAKQWNENLAVYEGRDDPNEYSLFGKIGEAADEFTRNYTGGLDALAGAVVTPNWLTSEKSALSGLDFWERRDVLNRAQDMEAEAALPRGVDNAVSLAGVLGLGSGPAAKSVLGWGNAAKAGATAGAIEGAGHSSATDFGGLSRDMLLGGSVGAGTGVAADFLLDKVVGGGFRKAFADVDTPDRLAAHEKLGIPPSIGAIGNTRAASLENAMAEAPLTNTVGSFVDMLPFTGRSAAGVQARQIDAVDTALSRKVTDDMVPPGTKLAQTDSAMAPYLRETAQTNYQRLGDEVTGMENSFYDAMDPRTPVGLRRSRALPREMVLKEGDSKNIANAVDAELDIIGNNIDTSLSPRSRSVVDPKREGVLQNRLGTATADIKSTQKQMDKLLKSNPDDPQLKTLGSTMRKLNTRKANIEKDILNNRGPGVKALRQDRGKIGSRQGEGLYGYGDDRLYGKITEDIEAAAYNTGGEKLRKKFQKMTKRETEIYLQKKLLEPLTTKKGASTNLPFMKRALLKGNDEELAALTAKLKPEELGEFRANALHTLGRNNAQDPFNASTFATSWAQASHNAKQTLTGGSPETLAVLDAIAEVSRGLKARGSKANTSNSSTNAGVMAMLGAAVGSPEKIMSFLATAGGVDRIVASEAMTKAVAGDPTQLGQFIRRATTNLAASPEGLAMLYEELGVEE